MRRALAALLSAALILTAPGLSGYAAAASVLTQRAAVTGASGAQASPTGAVYSSPVSRVSLQLGSAGLKSSWAAQAAGPGVMARAAARPLAAPIDVGESESLPLPRPVLGELEAQSLARQAAPKLSELLAQRAKLNLSVEQAGRMSAGAAKTSAAAIMDRILGLRPAAQADSVATSGPSATLRSLLAPSVPARFAPKAPVPAAAPARALGRVFAAGGAVLGLQSLAAHLLPAVFGLVPMAAVWAVSSGALLLPIALFARYRLSLRDSPRLARVKWLMDAAIGAFLGALVLAAPSLAALVSAQQMLAASLPLAGLLAGRALGGGGSSMLDGFAIWGAMALPSALLGVAAAGAIGLGPLLGLAMLPVMTTLSFFLGRIVHSAESGRPFSVPGGLQKLRFPAFQWVMAGVVFALLSGFGAAHTTLAFMAWQFLGGKRYSWDPQAPLWRNLARNVLNFNTLYLGLLAFTAATGFLSPLTFLALAFAPERLAVWTEALLGRLLPKSEPAPSRGARAVRDPAEERPEGWPDFHYWLKTLTIIGSMAAMGFGLGATVFGLASLGKNLMMAAAVSAVSFLFSPQIIKVTMKDKPATEKDDPEFFAIMKDLRGLINAKRQAQGQKSIPMPELVDDPLAAPNAYATGRSPFQALVGVTKGIKEMLLDGENLRAGIMRLLATCDPEGKDFKVFRLAIAGSIPGVAPRAKPREVAEAVRKASAEDLKKLGARALRGVLAHEFSHVLDRHMLLSAMAGSLSSGVAFASYGLMWAVGHAQAAAKRLRDRFFPPRLSQTRMGIEPITAGLAVKSWPALLRVFAALWGPVVLQVTQMASSRADEGMADADGAELSGDPEALALALGLLSTWRPKEPGPAVAPERLPLVAANARLFTVNPLEQMQKAGALPQMDAASEAVVGRQDDFLFDLFVTHPDTMQRIERLYDMAAAKSGKN